MRDEIRIEGELVDVGDKGWDLELVNPMFDFDRPGGSRAYDIELKDTDRNRRIIGNVGSPMVRTEGRLYYTEITRGGNLIDKGFSLLKATKGAFGMGFTSNLSEFFGEWQSKPLTDIDFGTVPEVSDWLDTLANAWNDGGFVAPSVKNELYYEKNAPVGWNGVMNEFVSGDYTEQVKVPMFFLKYVMKAVGDLAGVSYAGDYWDSVMLAKTLVVNTRAAEGAIDIRKHLPRMTIADVLLGLRKLYDIVLRFDVKNKRVRMDFGKDILKRSARVDWSDKFPRLKVGMPIWTDGMSLNSGLDGGDGLNKEEFFWGYNTPIVGSGRGGYVKADTVWSSLMMDAGVPVMKQAGVGSFQPDKQFGARLMYWEGGDEPVASNEFDGVVMKWNGGDGLAANYWAEEEKFRKDSFVIEETGALTATDIARMAAIFRGELDEDPTVHIWGVDWLVEKIVVPSGMKSVANVKLWRK